MPLYNETKAHASLPVVDPIRIEDEQIKSIVTDTRYEPHRNLLRFIEGSSWTTLYYSQVLATNSALSGQQVDVSATNQQYQLIKNFELKVTRQIESTQDDQSGTMTTTGAANLYPGVIPNVGDMFVADCGDGRNGIFKVTVSNRKTISKDTCYEIEYIQTAINDSIKQGDLNQKVIRTFEFVKDYLNYGRTPVIKESDFITLTKLNDHYNYLVDYYFTKFYSDNLQLLMLPGQNFRIHDVFINRFVLNLLDTFKNPKIRYVRRLNTDEDECLTLPSIWDGLAKRDRRLTRGCFRKYSLVKSTCFSNRPQSEGIYYSGASLLIYPKDYDTPIDYLGKLPKIPDSTVLENKKTIVRDLDELITVDHLNGIFDVQLPRMIPEIGNEYYVLSKSFYENNKSDYSYFELLIDKYLKDEKIEFNQLEVFCRASTNWNLLEQYYYIPIILLLIRSATMNVAF